VALEIRPEFRVTLAKRTASSDCHGAKLDRGTEPGTFTCRECGQPCERVLSDPEEVTAHG
jgi:hypothetical protein